MNRLIFTASRSVAPSLRINHGALSSPSTHILSARHFSDSDSAATVTATASDTEGDSAIQLGTVKRFDGKHHYGFIIPDSVDRRRYDATKDLVFIHSNEIKTVTIADEERIYPKLMMGQRVQYKVGPPKDGKRLPTAYELFEEGGKMVPPFRPKHMEKYAKTKKLVLGHEAFDIFGTAKDQTELETKLVAAYDKARDEIERQAAKVERVMKAYEKEDEEEGKEEEK